jgi:hypothetical protein
MTFLSPPFNPFADGLLHGLPMDGRNLFRQRVEDLRNQVHVLPWGHRRFGETTEKLIIRRGKYLIPHLMPYFRQLREWLTEFGSEYFLKLTPCPKGATTTRTRKILHLISVLAHRLPRLAGIYSQAIAGKWPTAER